MDMVGEAVFVGDREIVHGLFPVVHGAITIRSDVANGQSDQLVGYLIRRAIDTSRTEFLTLPKPLPSSSEACLVCQLIQRPLTNHTLDPQPCARKPHKQFVQRAFVEGFKVNVRQHHHRSALAFEPSHRIRQ